jgi:aminoglycoside 6'-N-acetyltransferase I
MRVALWPDADDELDEFLVPSSQVAFVAERSDGTLCGFLEAGIRPFANGVDEQPCAFVEGWWVDSDVRRTGVGRALMAAAEAWARSRGFTELGSDTELANVGSQNAHKALGFEERERVVYLRKRL